MPRRLAALAALLLTACADGPPPLSPAVSASGFSDSLPEGGGTSSAPAASASALPALPTGVVECEPADGPDFGDAKPSVAEVERAIAVAGDKACLTSALRTDGVRACAARVGSATVRISTDDLRGPSGCEVTIHGAKEGARRWIVFSTFYREKNAQFWGATTAVELTPSDAIAYVSTLVPEQAPLCPETGATGAVAPKDLPAGWSGLSGSLHAFLCSGK